MHKTLHLHLPACWHIKGGWECLTQHQHAGDLDTKEVRIHRKGVASRTVCGLPFTIMWSYGKINGSIY